MKYIRYKKYIGEPADEVDLETLIQRLSDFFLQSGFESQFYDVNEFDPDRSMEALRQAIEQALAEGDLIPEDLLQQLLEQDGDNPNPNMKELIDRLIERLMQEGYIDGPPPHVTPPPGKTPRGGIGEAQEHQANARFEITDKTIDFLGFKALRDLLGSLGKSSFGRHDTRDLAQ